MTIQELRVRVSADLRQARAEVQQFRKELLALGPDAARSGQQMESASRRVEGGARREATAQRDAARVLEESRRQRERAELVMQKFALSQDKAARSAGREADAQKKAADSRAKQAQRKFDDVKAEGWEKAGRVGEKAGLLVAAGMGLMLKAAADYEQAGNVLQAQSRTSTQEMAAMDKMARQLGADLTLPATSSKDAMTAMLELSKGGLTLKDTMGAARGVLELSAAAQIKNAQAAEITANALNMFKLPGTEAGKVANLLAGAALNASGEVTDMAAALQQSGTMFQQAKIPIEDAATAIALMAKNGVMGSDAGTSLKTMLMRLIDPTKEAAAVMEHLKISTHDAQGQMRPFREIIAQFSQATQHLTDKRRGQALATVFEADAVRAASIVLAGGTQEWDKMHVAVTRSGQAKELAAARTKGLSGAVEGLKSQLESLSVNIGTTFLPQATQFLQSINGLLERFQKMPAQTQANIVKYGALGVAFVVIGTKVAGLVKWVMELRAAWAMARTAALGAAAANQLAAGAGVAGVAGGGVLAGAKGLLVNPLTSIAAGAAGVGYMAYQGLQANIRGSAAQQRAMAANSPLFERRMQEFLAAEARYKQSRTPANYNAMQEARSAAASLSPFQITQFAGEKAADGIAGKIVNAAVGTNWSPGLKAQCQNLVNKILTEAGGRGLGTSWVPDARKKLDAMGARRGAGMEQPGDIIIWTGRKWGNNPGAREGSHTGIYLGGGKTREYSQGAARTKNLRDLAHATFYDPSGLFGGSATAGEGRNATDLRLNAIFQGGGRSPKQTAAQKEEAAFLAKRNALLEQYKAATGGADKAAQSFAASIRALTPTHQKEMLALKAKLDAQNRANTARKAALDLETKFKQQMALRQGQLAELAEGGLTGRARLEKQFPQFGKAQIDALFARDEEIERQTQALEQNKRAREQVAEMSRELRMEMEKVRAKTDEEKLAIERLNTPFRELVPEVQASIREIVRFKGLVGASQFASTASSVMSAGVSGMAGLDISGGLRQKQREAEERARVKAEAALKKQQEEQRRVTDRLREGLADSQQRFLQTATGALTYEGVLARLNLTTKQLNFEQRGLVLEILNTDKAFLKWQEKQAVIQQFADGTRNIVSGLFSDLMQGGKNFFGNMIAGFTQMFQQIAVQFLTNQVMRSLGGLFGGGGGFPGVAGPVGGGGGGAFSMVMGALGSSFGGFFAGGGYMRPNTWNVVGELGPELVYSGGQGGTVVPNGAVPAAAAPISITLNINNPIDVAGFRHSQGQLLQDAYREAERITTRYGGRA